ncbi:hypothetical protein CRI70_30230 [Streptomyces sp. Ru87]|nr:hypothetical protein CRI70_30230 [Streptomyces sp. Ru87]
MGQHLHRIAGLGSLGQSARLFRGVSCCLDQLTSVGIRCRQDGEQGSGQRKGQGRANEAVTMPAPAAR